MSRSCSWFVGCSFWFRDGLHIGDPVKEIVESREALFSLNSITLNPFGHEVEDLRLEVHGTTLRVATAADEPCVFEDLQVLRDRLQCHLVGFSKFVDSRIGCGKSSDYVPPGRIGKGLEDLRKRVSCHSAAT